jgi:hypothetical protein
VADPKLPPVPPTEGDILAKLDLILAGQKRLEEAAVLLLQKAAAVETGFQKFKPYLEEAERRFGPMLKPKGAAAPAGGGGFLSKLFGQ